MKVLLCTIAIGGRYLRRYNRVYRPSQRRYAKRQGYDFRVVSRFLDRSCGDTALASFQKALVGVQRWSRGYDRIVFVDADVYIRDGAPPIHESLDPAGGIGVVDEYRQPSLPERLELNRRMGWETDAASYYRLCGFEIDSPSVVNTGVLALDPERHGALLASIYERHREAARGHPRGFHFEQSAIGFELQQAAAIQWLPGEWNHIWEVNRLARDEADLLAFIERSNFVHFAGGHDGELRALIKAKRLR